VSLQLCRYQPGVFYKTFHTPANLAHCITYEQEMSRSQTKLHVLQRLH